MRCYMLISPCRIQFHLFGMDDILCEPGTVAGEDFDFLIICRIIQTLERSGSKHRRKALKALNPLLTAFRKSRPKIKAACNDANTTQNNIHSFHNYFFFYLYGVRSWRCRKLSIRSSLNVPSFHILSNSASAI